MKFVPKNSLTTLNGVRVPDGVDDAAVRKQLLERYGIEIGAGLGPFKGKAWRIGLMGYASSQRNVLLILAALETLLEKTGALRRGESLRIQIASRTLWHSRLRCATHPVAERMS